VIEFIGMTSILIVEDDTDICDFLQELLGDEGYEVQTANDGASALRVAGKSKPDLVLLDLILPKISGETVCRQLKKKFADLPILIISARGDKSDIVRGLELGADDYITKPFVEEELLARIKANLRRVKKNNEDIKVADLELNSKNFEVKRAGKLIQLTPKEYKLLQYLMINKNRILSREMILNRIWLYSPDIESRAVDVYIGYLREKIDKSFKNKLIHTVRGFGYKISESP